MNSILIVEDEIIIRSALKRLLERHAYQVSVASSVQEAIENFKLADFDLIISDLKLPGSQGTDLIPIASGIPVLIMTSYANLRSAVFSIKAGAVDYIAKPFDYEEMLQTVKRILEEHAYNRSKLQEQLKPSAALQQLIGESQSIKDLLRGIQKVAPTDATVLIVGESGTGKELIARAIHEQSPRAEASLITVNCAAIPETLIESELFGYEKGAFTGANTTRHGLVEAAEGGTLFLDEIGELPLEAQSRLLRVIQEGEVRRIGATQSRKVNIRLLAATHRNLKVLTKAGAFREDLYYRLNVIQLVLPPLRERGADILLLAHKLLERICQKLNKPLYKFSREALELIQSYSWPGNVREMENALERASILCETDTITKELLGIESEKSDLIAKSPTSSLASSHSLEDYFQHFIIENQDHMTETELAQKLGISRKSLWERRQRLGIPRKKADLS